MALPVLIISPCSLERGVERKNVEQAEVSPLAIIRGKFWISILILLFSLPLPLSKVPCFVLFSP